MNACQREEECSRAQSNVLKGSLPQGPSAHPRNTEYPKLSEESEKESRDEVTQRGMEGLYQKESRDDVTHRGMEGLYQKESRDDVTHRGMEELYQRFGGAVPEGEQR